MWPFLKYLRQGKLTRFISISNSTARLPTLWQVLLSFWFRISEGLPMVTGCWIVVCPTAFILMRCTTSGEVRTAWCVRRGILRRGCITDLLSQIGLKLLQINPWCHLLLERIPLKLMCTNQVLHFCYKWNPVRKPACSLKLRSSCRLVWWKRNLSTSILKEKQQLTKLMYLVKCQRPFVQNWENIRCHVLWNGFDYLFGILPPF